MNYLEIITTQDINSHIDNIVMMYEDLDMILMATELNISKGYAISVTVPFLLFL